MINLKCFKCKSNLIEEYNSYLCTRCGTKIDVKDGIICCLENSSPHYNVAPHYNIIPRNEMQRYLARITQIGWDKAFYELQKSMPDEAHSIYTNVIDFSRAGWKFILPLSRSAKVLDVGCGWGSISSCMAQTCDEVISIDITKERLQSLQKMNSFHNINNITYINADISSGLPFNDDYFDIIVISGVLEWIPEYCSDDPREIQLKFMKEILRISKPDGAVYLAIENRYAYHYVMYREDHTGMMWASFLPRTLSNIYSKIKRGKPYRTYTHSYYGYKLLLKEAGMRASHFYVPLPDYRYPLEIIDIEKTENIKNISLEKYDWKQRIKRNSIFCKLMAYSFSILITKNNKIKDSLIDKLTQELNCHELTIIKYEISYYSANLFCTDEKQRKCVIKLPYRKGCLRTCNNAKALKRLESFRDLKNIKKVHFPKLLFEGTIEDQYVSVETLLDGMSLIHCYKENNTQNIFSDIRKFLIIFAAASCELSEQSSFNYHMKSIIEDIKSSFIDKTQQRQFDIIGQRILSNISKFKGPYVSVHGDFNLKNCIWDTRENNLAGVVGWDLMETMGLPGWDMLNFFVSMRERRQKIDKTQAMIQLFLKNEWDEQEKESWELYLKEVGLHKENTQILWLSFWVRNLWVDFHYGTKNLDFNWVESVVKPMLDMLV